MRALYILIAVFVAATIYLLYAVDQRQVVLRDVVHHNDAWALSQSIQEILRLETAIANYLISDEITSRSEIRLRLDIAISRLDVLQQGTVGQFLEALPVQAPTFSELNSAVTQLDTGLESMTEQDLQDSFSRLADLIAPLTGLSARAIQESWISTEQNLNELEYLQQIFALVVATLILCWCGLAGLMFRQNRRLSLTQQESAKLNEELLVASQTLKDTNRSLKYSATHDSLTHLPNRSLFWDDLNHALSLDYPEKSTVSLLLIDLNDFKTVNDRLGHDVGDELLEQLSSRLIENGSNSDSFYRLGGDEFAGLQYNKAPAESIEYARQLVRVISNPYIVNGLSIEISCSIGVVVSDISSDTSGQTLFKQADIALYRAKTFTGDPVCLFECEMQTEFDKRKSLEVDLRTAISRNQIEVAYQVQLDVHRQRVRGCEALARWQHGDYGFVSPAEFIPIAEETGLIHDLGRYILSAACAEAVSWPHTVKIAVNVSALQLKAPDFLDIVQNVLAETGIDPRRLELEITESVFLDTRDSAISMIHRLREIGITIALDDFGTGYSSLAVLREIPIDTIKLDKTFVKNIEADPQSRELLRLISELAAMLQKEVLVEGIETSKQYEIVRACSCATVQGYLFGHPIPASSLIKHLDAPDFAKGVKNDAGPV